MEYENRETRKQEQTLLAFEKLVLSLERELQTARLSRRKYNKLAMRQKVWEYIYYSQDYEMMSLILDKFEIKKPDRIRKLWKVELSRSWQKPIYYEDWGILIDWRSCTNWRRAFSHAEWIWQSRLAELFSLWMLDSGEVIQAMDLLDCNWRITRI